jgi:hypothetical protein
MSESNNEPTKTPPAEWLTYYGASVRLGLSQTAVAFRARRNGWPTRVCVGTGEHEVRVPGFILAARDLAIDRASEEALDLRVANAVSRVDRFEATQARNKANAEDRAATIASASAKRPWWRLRWRFLAR